MDISTAYHVVHNMQLLQAFRGRQGTLVAMKSKSGSRLNLEDELLCALLSIQPQIFSFFIHFWYTKSGSAK